jgi:hypothetical protein
VQGRRYDTNPKVENVQTRLAAATAERVIAGNKPMEVARVRITEVGRQALTARDSEQQFAQKNSAEALYMQIGRFETIQT